MRPLHLLTGTIAFGGLLLLGGIPIWASCVGLLSKASGLELATAQTLTAAMPITLGLMVTICCFQSPRRNIEE